jgi:hypothetical protein
MKKNEPTLYEQIEATIQLVNKWPESVKTATQIDHAEFFSAPEKQDDIDLSAKVRNS